MMAYDGTDHPGVATGVAMNLLVSYYCSCFVFVFVLVLVPNRIAPVPATDGAWCHALGVSVH